MSSPTNDQIWFNYAQGILDWAGKNNSGNPPDSNTAYFIATAVNKGPAAGSFVPDETMNESLVSICDPLILDSSPIYNPGTDGSYFQAVENYLLAVVLKKDTDPALAKKLADAVKISAAASKAYQSQLNVAVKGWKDDPLNGKPAGVPFSTWVANNDSNLTAAQLEKAGSAQTVMQLQSQINGPQAALLNQQNSLCVAATQTALTPGCNMECSLDQINPAEYRKYFKALQDGTIDKLKPLKAKNDFTKQAYSIDPTFKATMDDWAKVPVSDPPQLTWSINSSSMSQSSWSQLGHEDGSAGIQFGFIRIGGGGSTDWKDSGITNTSGSFEIQLSAQRAGLFNVNPGSWNVEQLKQTYPNTSGVSVIENAVQPTQLFCASRVTLKIKFTGSMANTFDKLATDVKQGSGGLSILGFTIGGSGGESETDTTHTSTLEQQDGWYVLEPTLIGGACSMLAVIGNKFSN
ncbi:hypothetical protein F53441_770 [Fusarium austroafricanum]|uniref:Uncharacterized protein n=1 Tax=Fusarium austroafricanum TaxID=2364996 RepID=A0A8H4KUX5_9HYPO|nr:hypothetical protein F53441_770 [Fusarium austroafricanum]